MAMMTSNFIHLHTHSHYSLLNALPKIDELIEEAKKNEMDSIALTDAGNLYGTIEFYKKCKKEEIKPIIGIDAYLSARTRFDKEAGVDKPRTRIILLSKNYEGYKNLMKIVSKSYLEGFYYKPRIDYDLLKRYNKGIIILIPSFSSEATKALRVSDEKKAKEIVDWYIENYGKENVFYEITHHPEIEGHTNSQKKVKNFCAKNKIPLVAGQEVYYIHSEDRLAYETMQKIQSGGEIERDFYLSKDRADFSFINEKTVKNFFKDTPGAIENTKKIANMCNLKLELGRWIFPNFKIDEEKTPDEVLRENTYKKIAKKGLEKTEKLTKRVEYELKIISDKGFSSYFLIVADLLNFARENNILQTTRGSAAGSLVCFLNGVTNIDPLKFELPFERFLNPERPKAPDIDMDFADDRRDEVIQYTRNKYGKNRVAQIGTFGTMMARGVVRDITRAFDYSYNTGDKIAKLIPFGSQGFPMTIDKAIEQSPELAEIYEKEEGVKKIIDMAKKIEGCARHISVHAAGVVISPTDITDYTPVQFDPKSIGNGGKLITQYDMHAVEDAGLIKFDFLGIRNLSILADSIERVKDTYGVEIDTETIPLDDQNTFDMLARGETMGAFQLGGSGMTRYLRELCPSNIHDINAMIALYRPGPIEAIPSYIERKHNPSMITYLDPRLKEILYMSYGVITYQDDVLLIAIKLASYTWLEADDLRKAMGKKIPKKMKEHRKKLFEGFVKNGMTEQKAEQMWKLIEPFAAYGFNKAHAASYGRVAYQTAYMKANYPVEFMTSLLSADAGEVEKISESIKECNRLKISVLPPNINESFSNFTATSKKDEKLIRFGLNSIKNFGGGIANTIIEEREKNGKFKNLTEFFERIKDKNLNKKSFEALVKSGAMDNFEERGKLLSNTDLLLKYNRQSKDTPEGQNSLFENTETTFSNTFKLEDANPLKTEEKLSWEKELLGLYISGHPLDKHKESIKKTGKTIRQAKTQLKPDMNVFLIGLIETSKTTTTKKGERMMFITLSDYSDKIEAVIFPKIYEEYKDIIETEKCVAVKGRLSARGDEMNILVEKIKEI